MKEIIKKYGTSRIMKRKDCNETQALLTIKEFPQTTRGREMMSNWLRQVADKIDESKPEEYSKSVRFRLMR